MRQQTHALAAFALGVVLAPFAALAAAPDYCAFYAREYVIQFDLSSDEAQLALDLADQAYFRCLNADAAPALPEDSAYAGTDLDASTWTDGIPSSADIAQGDSDVEETTTTASSAPLNARPARQTSRSGREPWSEEWFAWCKKHFPNSFDEETGMVVPLEGPKRFC